MLMNLQQTLWKVMLFSLIFGGILIQATGITAQADSKIEAESTSVPGEQTVQYKYFFPVMSASPLVKLSDAWTADSQGNPKTTFVPGETIRFYINGFNLTGSTSRAAFTWYQDGPCGSNTLSIETVNLSIEDWTRYKTSIVPNCVGIYTFILDVSLDGQVTSYRTTYVVNNPSRIINTTRQAFDRCNIPTTSQMQTWWRTSPYFGINLYMGGVSRGCSNSGLNEYWVHNVSQQGWELIPTWVGPQAPCSTFRHKMSSNPTTAYNQGRNEAAAAASVASALGISRERVIYYDLEGYATYATLTCRSTVQSFLKGWTERLHELGVKSGVYGAAYSSYMNDWPSIDPPPDYVWIASWNRTYYDPNASVWGVNRLSDSLWPDHQRLRQYAGDHVETWGGISFTIDSNVTDGAVTVLPKQSLSSMNSEDLQSTDRSTQLRNMQQVSPEYGWVLIGQNLLWTGDGGAHWNDITPALAAREELLNGHFLDESKGWLLSQDLFTNVMTLYWTEDQGTYWEPAALPASSTGFDPQIQSANLFFVDPQYGWISLKHTSSSNFSLGSLYRTKDGGKTWNELAIPVSGKIYFLDSERGWLVGGASGSELYATFDGGETWDIHTLPLSEEVDSEVVMPALPAFDGDTSGYLPVTVADPKNPRVEVFASEDSGATWDLQNVLPLDPGNLPGTSLSLRVTGQGQFYLASPGGVQLLSLEPGPAGALQTGPAMLPGSALDLNFVLPSSGWAQVQESVCEGFKGKPGETLPLDQTPFSCELDSFLYKTSDGGRTWTDITP